ncbi:hypothetical protein [Streptomyces coeruleorubidus]|uniref:hypothetical protein n=1 Tax=Streptomyces coeruleorubidus TaxID=116188 RepID=UPI0036C941A1
MRFGTLHCGTGGPDASALTVGHNPTIAMADSGAAGVVALAPRTVGHHAHAKEIP